MTIRTESFGDVSKLAAVSRSDLEAGHRNRSIQAVIQVPPVSSPRLGFTTEITPYLKTANGRASNETTFTNDTNEETPHGYNVYAKPFIPSMLQSINHEWAGVVIVTEPKHFIDFTRYIATFTGTSFLPEATTEAVHNASSDGVDTSELSIVSYLRYFKALYDIEETAKLSENENLALYKVPLYRTLNRDDELWALSVPGLREDHPFIEMGDVLQLRQLWVDGSGELLWMPSTVDNHLFNPYGGYPLTEGTFWRGIQYNASVYAVNRAREIVYLRVKDLTELYVGQMAIPVAVNVVIPLKESRQNTLRKALESTASLLLSTARIQDSNGVSSVQENSHQVSRQDSHNTLMEYHQNTWIRKILFPGTRDGRWQRKLRSIPNRLLFDSAINFEQAHAVNDVCVNHYGVLPYLISGPPGTGKTKTLVEMTMQLLNTADVAHILVCAPSEAAADTLALRLKTYLNTKQLFRLNSPTRSDVEVPKELTPYCYMESDMFTLPPFKTMMAFNVVVTSCRDAAILIEAHLTNSSLWYIERNTFAAFHPETSPLPSPSLHWGTLLIDEAAQATELDVLPALNVITPPSSYDSHLTQPRFVMAGDEHQLGPRTASRDPRLCTSLFARLSSLPLYADHPLSRSHSHGQPPVLKSSMLPILYPAFTNLIRNYRSHAAILSVPSALFYNNTLLPLASVPETSVLQHSPIWRAPRKWPVLYVPHTGADDLERDGGAGWYNPSEARTAAQIAYRFVTESGVQQSEVAIISPFAAQVRLLRRIMRAPPLGMWDVNIGPLEAFQGLEKRVVILCTTRSRAKFVDEDVRRGVGVVLQHRKMNVALTRAREGLVVLGHPQVLGRDECWREWMAFCWRNGLVWDEMGVWTPKQEEMMQGKVGVLERALLARQNQDAGDAENDGKRGVLGAAADDSDARWEYEEDLLRLREELEEKDEGDGDEDEKKEGQEEYVQDAVKLEYGHDEDFSWFDSLSIGNKHEQGFENGEGVIDMSSEGT